MRNHLAVVWLLAVTVLLSACAPVPPVPDREPQPLPPVEPRQPPPRPEPAPPPREPAPVSAVQSLLQQGWTRYRQQDYRGALSLAERAQRIDARSAEVYLLMASAQFSLARLAVAEQLVRRGLAMSTSGSSVHQQLQTLLSRIAAAP